MTKSPQKIKCPECDKLTLWHSSNPFRPFCSRKCKLIDLGEWLDGKRSIPGQSDYRSESSSEDRDGSN